MTTPDSIRPSLRRCLCVLRMLAVVSLLLLPGACEQHGSRKHFTTPEEAAEALAEAYRSNDHRLAAKILDDKALRLVFSGDPVIDRHERDWVLSLYEENHRVETESENRAVLYFGEDEQPYPIPIVKVGNQWRFDAGEGHEDLLSRRMSKTELSALDIVLAYVDAQRQYHEQDPDRDGVLEYAQKFRSSPGHKDGLYWERKPDELPSPVNGLASTIRKEGYALAKKGELPIYRGYYYKILTAQGAHAHGGAHTYVVDGKMTGGFALVAFPVRYGISGIMTFAVNQDGVIYQKDLGKDTVKAGRTMTLFNPDASWTRGEPR